MTWNDAKLVYFPMQREPINTCHCHYCHNEWSRIMVQDMELEWWRIPNRMILCPDCGCKRCPKATHHSHDCTRSNDSGQRGSVYGSFKIDYAWMDEDDE